MGESISIISSDGRRFIIQSYKDVLMDVFEVFDLGRVIHKVVDHIDVMRLFSFCSLLLTIPAGKHVLAIRISSDLQQCVFRNRSTISWRSGLLCEKVRRRLSNSMFSQIRTGSQLRKQSKELYRSSSIWTGSEPIAGGYRQVVDIFRYDYHQSSTYLLSVLSDAKCP